MCTLFRMRGRAIYLLLSAFRGTIETDSVFLSLLYYFVSSSLSFTGVWAFFLISSSRLIRFCLETID